MRRRILTSLALFTLLALSPAQAWEHYVLDLPSQGSESSWRDALAEHLGGTSEVPIEGGRVDVLTEHLAIELDWPHKWHEGLGQALHYADAMERQGALALIAYALGPDQLQERSKRRLEMVERLCEQNNIKLIVLFPNRPREDEETRLTSNQDYASATHWLNAQSGVRHNATCRFFKNTAQGHACPPDAGRACSICGG